MSIDFAPYMRSVAEELLGEPNKRLSSNDELRFGSNGSLSIDLKAGTFYDHETKEGGGVLALIARTAGTNANGGAVDWMREHGYDVDDDRQSVAAKGQKSKIVATYDYVDENGDLVFQVCRMVPKTFRQRRKPKASDSPERIRDGWVWSVKGVRLVPYKLPELLETLATDRLVFIVEGEKDVENLMALGVPATCNPMGAGKWPEHFPEFFKGADVVLLPHNDEAGRSHANLIGASLKDVVTRIRVLEIPGLAEKGDVSDWLDTDEGSAEALYDLVETNARPWTAETAKLHFEAVWFRDAETAMTDPEWLIDDVLTRGDKSLVYGESQSGKSFLATHLAMAVARGLEVLGHKVLRPGGVVYVAAEGKKGFKWRLKAYREHFKIAAGSDIPFVLFPVGVDMFAEGGDYEALIADIQILAELMKARGVSLDLVVFDTHSAVSPGANENASEDVSRMLKHYARVQQVTGAHVMIVHHKNAGGEKPRGHTSLYADVDNAIEVSNDNGARVARVAKLKDAQDGEKIGFRLQAVTIGQREADGKDITSCIVTAADAEARGPKGQRLTNQEKIAMDSLREVLATMGESLPASFGLPVGIKAVRAEHWKREFMSRAYNEEPEAAVFRSAIKRVGDGLMAKRIIGRQQPFIWIVKHDV